MVKTREDQLLREHNEHQRQLQQVVESLKDKLSQSEGKATTLTAGRLDKKHIYIFLTI